MFKRTRRRGTYGDGSRPLRTSTSASAPEKIIDRITLCNLFRYASLKDKVFAVSGLTCSILAGLVTPICLLMMSALIDLFVFQHYSSLNGTSLEEQKQFNEYMRSNSPFSFLMTSFEDGCMTVIEILFGCVCALFIFNFCAEVLLTRAGTKQSYRIRVLFMQSVLNQEPAWINKHVDQNFVQDRIRDLDVLQEGLGNRLGLFFSNLSTLIVSLFIAFACNWKLFLLMMSPLALYLLCLVVISRMIERHTVKEGGLLQKAAFIANEAMNNIRAAIAFNAKDREIFRFSQEVDRSQKHSYRKSIWLSISSSLIWSFLYTAYAIAFGFGIAHQLGPQFKQSHDAIEKEYDVSSQKDNIIVIPTSLSASHVMCPIFTLGLALLSLIKLVTYFGLFKRVRTAAENIYRIAETTIFLESEKPPDGEECHGAIRFESVSTVPMQNYRSSEPAQSSEDITLLDNFTLSISKGEALAIYDASWKSHQSHAIPELIQRFSEPISGSIFMDDNDIEELPVGWLRGEVAVIRQEPVLFSATIADNIRYGNPMIQQSDIEHASVLAFAHKFILKLPKKYETLINDLGGPLTLGQRQQICIARAIARNAKIVILENPTHNLRGDSAAMVMAAMQNATEGRTSILISNKAFKLRDQKRVVVLKDGRIQEEGSYDDLIKRKMFFNERVRHELSEMKEQGISPLGEILPPSGSILSRQIASFLEKDTSTEANEGFNEFSHYNPAVPYTIKRLVTYLHPYWHLVGVGCFFAIILSSCLSIYGVVFGNILHSLLLIEDEPNVLNQFIIENCIFLIILGIATSLAAFLHEWAFAVVSNRITRGLLKTLYQCVLSQPISWFDNPKNQIIDVIRILLDDVAQLKILVGAQLSLAFQAAASLICWFVLSLYFYWKLSLSALCFAPVILICVLFEHVVLSCTDLDPVRVARCNKLARDIISKIKTVKSLHQEHVFCASYAGAVGDLTSHADVKIMRYGLLYAVSQSVPLLSYAVIFYLGYQAILDKSITDFTDIFKLTESIIFGSLLLAQSLALFAPNYSKARRGAAFIFSLRESLNEQWPNSVHSVNQDKEICDGIIEFQDVHFRYSSCIYIYTHEQMVLKGVSFKVLPSQMVAIAGEAGSGKRTCLELLEMFNVPSSGTILIDNKPLNSMNSAWVRSQLSIVCMEPHFSADTVWNNVAYGITDRQVTHQIIVSACELCNIHAKIMHLGRGYQTVIQSYTGADGRYREERYASNPSNIGSASSLALKHDVKMSKKKRGASANINSVTQLSPGDEVLLSMARAIVRRPKILLVDQTGWDRLSPQELSVIENSLENVRNVLGLTILIISPRFSTAEKCDSIYLLQQGRIVDQGTHTQLLTKRPRYRRLYRKELHQKGHPYHTDGGSQHLSRSDSVSSMASMSSNGTYTFDDDGATSKTSRSNSTASSPMTSSATHLQSQTRSHQSRRDSTVPYVIEGTQNALHEHNLPVEDLLQQALSKLENARDFSNHTHIMPSPNPTSAATPITKSSNQSGQETPLVQAPDVDSISINTITPGVATPPKNDAKQPKKIPAPLVLKLEADNHGYETDDDEVPTPETPRKRIGHFSEIGDDENTENKVLFRQKSSSVLERLRTDSEHTLGTRAVGRENDTFSFSSDSEDDHQLQVANPITRRGVQPSEIIRRLSQKKLNEQLQQIPIARPELKPDPNP